MKNTPYYFEDDTIYFDKGYVPDYRTIMQNELEEMKRMKRGEEHIKSVLLSKDKVAINTLRQIITHNYPEFTDIFEKYIVIS